MSPHRKDEKPCLEASWRWGVAQGQPASQQALSLLGGKQLPARMPSVGETLALASWDLHLHSSLALIMEVAFISRGSGFVRERREGTVGREDWTFLHPPESILLTRLQQGPSNTGWHHINQFFFFLLLTRSHVAQAGFKLLTYERMNLTFLPR